MQKPLSHDPRSRMAETIEATTPSVPCSSSPAGCAAPTNLASTHKRHWQSLPASTSSRRKERDPLADSLGYATPSIYYPPRLAVNPPPARRESPKSKAPKSQCPSTNDQSLKRPFSFVSFASSVVKLLGAMTKVQAPRFNASRLRPIEHSKDIFSGGVPPKL